MARMELAQRSNKDDSGFSAVQKDTEQGLQLLKPARESPKHFYRSLINAIKNLLDGIIDSTAFEDITR